MGLGYYSLTLKIAEGILICMAVSLLPVGFLLKKLKTGVVVAPWSVGHVASLSVSVNEPNVRGLWDVLREIRQASDDGSTTSKTMAKHLEGYKLSLSEYQGSDGITKYGILAHEKGGSNPHIPSNDCSTYELAAIMTHDPNTAHPKQADLSRPSLHTTFQIIALILLSGLFILITYYESVEINPHEPDQSSITVALSFEQFMDSQSIGVSILFTSLAVCITFFWDYLLSRMVTTSWWTILSSGSAGQLGRKEMLTSPPITVFDGFGKSTTAVTVTYPLLSTHVCLAGILSKAIPILMAHIPFRRYQTWGLHLATGWTTVVILGYMIAVLGAYLLVRNQLPVMPDCIAGVVYYLSCDDGEVVRDFERGQGLEVIEKDNVGDGPVRGTGQGVDVASTQSRHDVRYVFVNDPSHGCDTGERRVGFRRVVL
ncbi:hypothetical protein V8F20_010958 [Naviculisporaceae sp. PSN 640]